MDNELKLVSNLALFAHVVEAGSITLCAARLGCEPTTIARRINALESRLGQKMLDRSPQGLTATGAGERCYEECTKLVQAANDAVVAIHEGTVINRRRAVLLAAPGYVAEFLLPPLLDAFSRAHPSIKVKLAPVETVSDSSAERFDLAISVGSARFVQLQSQQTGLVPQRICASRAYFERAGTPRSVSELQKHDCIVVDNSITHRRWQFTEHGKVINAHVKPSYTVSDNRHAHAAALAGLGIACLPDFVLDRSTQPNGLQYLSLDLDPAPIPLHLVWSQRTQSKFGVTLLRHELEQAFQDRFHDRVELATEMTSA